MADQNWTIDNYKCSKKGLVMPFVNEFTWAVEFRAALYFIGLLWCFLGVAIIADVFMCAIEKITSKTRTVKVASTHSEKGYEEIEVRVWNDTVANLTLMALGSSAPEILLSIIEIVGNNFESGALGPSTIVGSAAFNLLVIIGVCVITIPDPDIRSIRAVKVFFVTAFFSIFAYIWLIIILVVISPDFVELWEAVLTFIFFPLMVILAYLADRDLCGKKKVDKSLEIGFDEDSSLLTSEGHVNEGAMREFIKELGKNPDLTEDDVAKLATARMQESQQHDRLWYRINATRNMTGSSKLIPSLSEKLAEIMEDIKFKKEAGEAAGGMVIGQDLSEGGSKAVVEFAATRASILENGQRVRVGLRRYGKMNNRVLFRIETIDGTAEATKDYHPVKQTMVFEKDETYKYIDIEIVDDNEWEPDEVFFVKMTLVDPNQMALVGKKSIMEITIINDDEPGTFEFAKPSLLFKESAGKALIPIERHNGADGKVTVSWMTEDMTAKNGTDFDGGKGELVFEHGETTKMLEIPIHDDQMAERDETFRILLTDVSSGAQLGRIKKTIISIMNDDDFNGMVSRLVDLTNMNVDALRVDTNTYADQFRNAMNVNGGDIDSATHLDYLMHFLTFGWKVIFACCPPPSIWGGWLAFLVALGMIGLLTMLVGDLASIFGCLVGLKDSVVAITFVALGTSLPDLFASKQAAVQEKYADASIGNVTGSNSVNVFLGLGLPWMIASIYWTIKGTTFEVKAGSLSFSVALYTICAVICLGIVILRRYVKAFGGELGGKTSLKWLSFCIMIFLWIMYILLSSLQAYDHIKVNF